MFNKAGNVQGGKLQPYDVFLQKDMYASTGGLFFICLSNQSNELYGYPYSWCDLKNPNWENEIKLKCSGIQLSKKNNSWYVKMR